MAFATSFQRLFDTINCDGNACVSFSKINLVSRENATDNSRKIKKLLAFLLIGSIENIDCLCFYTILVFVERPLGDVGSRVRAVVAGRHCVVAAVLALFNGAGMCFEGGMT